VVWLTDLPDAIGALFDDDVIASALPLAVVRSGIDVVIVAGSATSADVGY
jgi:hypothetical protein